jgi:hypothetical protein
MYLPMPRKLIIYSFLTFVMLPMSAILGIMAIVILFSAFGNPAAMLDVFILATFVLYSFLFYSFLIRGVQKGIPFKASFKDFIKVNGYAALIVSVLVVFSTAMFFTVPAVKNMVLANLVKSRPPSGVDVIRLNAMLNKVLPMCAGYCLLVGTHFIVCLQMLKRYGRLFVKQ